MSAPQYYEAAAVESGYGGQHTSVYHRALSDVRLRRRVRSAAVLLLTVCAAAGCVMAWNARWVHTVDALFAEMERLPAPEGSTGGSICVSTRHVGETSVDWVVFPARGLRLMQAEIVNTNGTRVETTEEADSRACLGAEGKVIRTHRHVRVRVHYSLPAKRPYTRLSALEHRTVDLEGVEAYCLQHMLDIFSERIQCTVPPEAVHARNVRLAQRLVWQRWGEL